jgi:RNA polymerase sigma-70 factor (ECF subfamily)
MENKMPEHADLFVRQLMLHRKKIYSFILTLVGNTSHDDDIMQDTAALMWEKYAQTEEISNFAALGMRVAHFKVLEFRKHQYESKLQFNNELFDSVLGGAVIMNETLDDRFEAMKKCLSKLDKESRQLIQMRHQKGQTIRNIAAAIKMPPHTAYKHIASLHDKLVRCVQRTLREEGLL